MLDFNSRQKDLLRDLKHLEQHAQKDLDYTKLREELAFAETGLDEAQAKLAGLVGDVARTAE